MKRIVALLAALILVVSISFGQGLNPVKFKWSSEKLSDNEYLLIFEATIEDGWYLYSQNIEGDGPIPTSFNWDENEAVSYDGATTEEGDKTKEGVDEMFDIFIKKFAHGARFTQKVTITEDTEVKGWLEFMTCDDEQCLPPDSYDFSFMLKVGDATESSDGDTDQGDALQEGEAVEEAAGDDSGNFNLGENQEILRPVTWTVNASEGDNGAVRLSFDAAIDEGWYVYAQGEYSDGPIPTTFTFEENENITLEGYGEEVSGHVVEGYDEFFEMDVRKFSDEVSFVYEAIPTKREGKIVGYFEFMTCEKGRCLPPEYVDFEVDLASLESRIVGEELPVDIDVENADWGIITAVDTENPVSTCGDVKVEDEGKGEQTLWVVFLLGIGGGLLALLTPCVFPMIPLTVSYFTKGSENRKKGLINAFLYGFFIFAVYVLISVPFHVLDGLDPDILNKISTSIPLNIAFFAIFVFFAFSFFGYYEITLPSWVANKSSSAEGAGGVIGIFFMALTLAIVSFSCTGPILGSLLALSSESGGGATQLTAGMAGFGIALALPFAIFAAFPGLMNSLPKSGGWLNTVKVVLGFLELALALKFLSNADLVKHWGILKYEVFIGLWIIIFILTAVYLLGKIKFPHDSPIAKLSKVRIGLAVICIAFVVYLFSAFRYNEKSHTFTSLGLLSGLAPPAGYSWIYPNPCPQNFNCFHDFYEAQAYAKEVGKPLMLDFTGHACVNCRKVEENVWPDVESNDIHRLIDEEYVLASLYVDEKINLPEEEQFTREWNGRIKTMRTTGDKWAFMEYANFKHVTQPYYVLLSPDGQLLNKPIGYSSSSDYIQQYQAFLECGLDAYDKVK